MKSTSVSRSIFKQLLFVWLAFFLMALISYLFVRGIVHNHLAKEAENTLSYTQSKIATDLLEAETTLQNISQNIRSMILHGNSADDVLEYMLEITEYLSSSEARVSGFNGIYGFFDVFEDKYLDGSGWVPPGDYVPRERPWHIAAVAANGSVTATPPYIDADTGEPVISYSRLLLDKEGNALGVVCVDVQIDKITKYVVGVHLAEGGYSMLLNDSLEVIASPAKESVGKPLAELKHKGVLEIVSVLKSGKDIYEHKVIDSQENSELVLFSKRFENGWHMGILTPIDKYYKEVNNMRLFIVALGAFLALVLSLILFRIAVAKHKSDAKNKMKSDFLANMSHEIRTPMNAIIGMAELALREDMPLTAKEHILIVKQAGTNLLSIINDILDFSKIESGKLEIVPVGYLFSSLLNDVVTIIKMRAIDLKLRFDVDIDNSIPNALFGDETRIRQVMLNVLSNAVKYTKKGFISFAVNGKITDDTVLLTINVTDSGVGIKKEDLGKLFGDFVQLDLESNKGVEGTGLGLAITKKLVNAMGGKINVNSEYGKGSAFVVELPQKIRSPEPLSMAEIPEERSVSDSSIVKFIAPRAKILIVDDINTNLQVAEGLMLPYKMQMDLCSSGIEAIEAVRESSYDLVFMDHMMPEMDGIEATKRIRKRDANLPIIALTANAVAGTKEMFLINGFNDFLSKPIDTLKLGHILGKWLPKEKQEKPEIIEADIVSEESADLKIEGVDVKKGISMTGGTLKRYMQTLAVFHKDGIEKIEEVKKCFEAENYPLYTTHIHALKSAAANIGAMELSGAAGELETAGKQGDFAFIKLHNPQFLINLEVILNDISEVLSSGQAQKKTADYELLSSELGKLKRALAALDSASIDDALNALQEFSLDEKISGNVDGILQNTMIGEYDEAISAIETFLKS